VSEKSLPEREIARETDLRTQKRVAVLHWKRTLTKKYLKEGVSEGKIPESRKSFPPSGRKQTGNIAAGKGRKRRKQKDPIRKRHAFPLEKHSANQTGNPLTDCWNPPSPENTTSWTPSKKEGPKAGKLGPPQVPSTNGGKRCVRRVSERRLLTGTLNGQREETRSGDGCRGEDNLGVKRWAADWITGKNKREAFYRREMGSQEITSGQISQKKFLGQEKRQKERMFREV